MEPRAWVQAPVPAAEPGLSCIQSLSVLEPRPFGLLQFWLLLDTVLVGEGDPVRILCLTLSCEPGSLQGNTQLQGCPFVGLPARSSENCRTETARWSQSVHRH